MQLIDVSFHMLPFKVTIEKIHKMKFENMIDEQETEKGNIRTAAEKKVLELEGQLNDTNFKIEELIQGKVLKLYIFFALNIWWIIIIFFNKDVKLIM